MLAALNRIGGAAKIPNAMSGSYRPPDAGSEWRVTIDADKAGISARQRSRKVALRVSGIEPTQAVDRLRVERTRLRWMLCRWRNGSAANEKERGTSEG